MEAESALELELFIASLNAVGQIIVVAAIGAVLARRGVITPAQRKCLAGMSMNIFLPCLLFTSLLYCEQCNCDSCLARRSGPTPSCNSCPFIGDIIVDSWYLFFWPFVVVTTGLVLGRLLLRILGCPPELQSTLLGAIAFGNSTGLPVVILSVVSPALQQGGVLESNPMLYLPVYLVLYPVLQWTVGKRIFGVKSGSSGSTDEEKATPAAEGRPPFPVLPASSSFEPLSMPGKKYRSREEHDDGTPAKASAFAAGHQRSSPCNRLLQLFLGGWLLPRQKKRQAAGRHVPTESTDVIGRRSSLENGDLPLFVDAGAPTAQAMSTADSVPAGLPTTPTTTYLRGKLLQVLGSDLVQNWLSPPVLASLLALLIALTPVRHWLVDVEQENEAPLTFLYKALKVLGSAAVPCQLLVLGTNLGNGPSFKNASLKFHGAIALTKMVLVPAVVIFWIFCLAQARVISGAHPEALLLMMVVSCTPTANNLIIMLETGGKDTSTMSTTIFVQYMLAPVLLTMSLTVFPMLLKSRWFGN
mmetsp:Transcript_15070/g.26806  ORF Transcript_15070/g.26806 Transcript_15070/m.26806 type:complete len:528 (+) Transcript_15070:45-1628(+)